MSAMLLRQCAARARGQVAAAGVTVLAGPTQVSERREKLDIMRARLSLSLYPSLSLSVCVCVCVRAGEREKERGREH